MAHCFRKLKDYPAAVQLYEKCLTINPNQAQTYAALGFAHHQIGQVQQALNCYHKANFLSHEDPMIEHLVQRGLEDIHDFPIEESYLKDI